MLSIGCLTGMFHVEHCGLSHSLSTCYIEDSVPVTTRHLLASEMFHVEHLRVSSLLSADKIGTASSYCSSASVRKNGRQPATILCFVSIEDAPSLSSISRRMRVLHSFSS